LTIGQIAKITMMSRYTENHEHIWIRERQCREENNMVLNKIRLIQEFLDNIGKLIMKRQHQYDAIYADLPTLTCFGPTCKVLMSLSKIFSSQFSNNEADEDVS